MIRRRIARWLQPLTVIGALMITALSMWLLGMLNARAIATVPPDDRIRTVVLMHGSSAESAFTEKRPEEPQPEEPEPQIMEVDLDMPDFDPIMPEPLELDLVLPSPTIVPLQVTIEQPPEPQPRTQPEPTAQATSATRPTPVAQPSARSAAHNASQVDQPPREAGSNAAPAYPPEMLQSGIEGVVTLRLLIDETGKVEDLQVLSGDEAFVRSVLAVVYRWRFRPAEHQGQPVKVWGLKKLRFSLREEPR